MPILPLILIALLAALDWPAHAAEPCGGPVPCEIGERSYRALPPPDWDGQTPLPVLLHFHGWGRQGKGVIANPRIADAANAAGMLLIAPNGLGKSWDFWREESRDIPFAEAVLGDAAKRWPIDRARVLVSGFSYGAAMAWRLACARGSGFAFAYLPIAGTLRGQERIACYGPARVVAVHGLKDTVMDLPRGPGGDVSAGVALWRRVNAVAEPPAESREDDYTCRDWQGLAPVRLCTHAGGHWIPKDWLARILPELLGR